MEYAGLTFDRSAIANVAAELDRQSRSRKDYVYPLNRLTYSDCGRLIFLGHDRGFTVGDRTFVDFNDAEQYLDHARGLGLRDSEDWKIEVSHGTPAIPLNDTAKGQLLEKLGVPGRFHNDLMGRGYSDVAAQLLRELLQRENRRVLVRTLDGRARAVLSDRYRIVSNSDLFFCAADKFRDVGAEVWQARLWDDGFQMYGVAGHIAGEVTTDRTFDPGDGWRSRWYGNAGDVHNPAVSISNSETGTGGLHVRIAILRRVCQNFCIWQDGVSQVHIGKKLSVDEGIILSEETKELEGKMLYSTIKDAIGTAFNEERFRELIAAMNGATADVIDEPKLAVDNVCRAYSISEDAKAAILAELRHSGDRSRFGLVQAVTHTAHGSEAAHAVELETLGGELLSMTSGKFAALATADA